MRSYIIQVSLLLGSAFAINYKSIAQDSTKNPLSFSGYLEAYFSYDFNKPAGGDKANFFYSHNRHDEFNLNLGFIKAAYNTEKVRANIALAVGTYMNANYSAESNTLKNICEANAGVKISRAKNLWIDAGIFSSHVGFESAVSKDCWNLSRSILAENSPYFESGAKITYTSSNNKWLLSGLLLNGWQRIRRVDGNLLLSFGTQIQYKPNASTLLNYSTFIGTDKPDSARLMRYFQNMYGIFNLNKKFALTIGFDIGMEQKAKRSHQFNAWYSPVVIAKYNFSNKWAMAARAEYYSDENNVIVTTANATGFKTAGFSVNADYAPAQNVLLRLEARTLKSKADLFVKENLFADNNSFITSSIAISF